MTLDLFGLLEGGTPLVALGSWMRVGAPRESAPGAEILEQADRGPAHIELARDELAVLEAVLETAFGVPGDAPPPTDEAARRLLDRGVLLSTAAGLSLAPSYLWSIGVAAFPNRYLGLAWLAATPASPSWITWHFLIGTRGAKLTLHADGVRIERLHSPAVQDELAAVLTAPAGSGDEVTGELSVPMSWSHFTAPEELPEQREEQVSVALAPSGVWWSSDRDDDPGAEQLSYEQARGRLRKAVQRGEATDLAVAQDAVALALRVQREQRNPLTRTAVGNHVAGIGLETLWPGLGRKRAAVHTERMRQVRLAEYWAPLSGGATPPPAPWSPLAEAERPDPTRPTFVSRGR